MNVKKSQINNKEKNLLSLSLLLCALLFPLIIILSNFASIFYNISFYQKELIKHEVYPSIPKADQYMHDILDFFKGEKNNLDTPFTENEKSHMNDVKNLLGIIFIILKILITGFLFLSIIIFIKWKKASNELNITKKLNYVAKLSFFFFIIIVVLFGFLLLSFQHSFIIFHKIFFPQGNWSFPEGSILITMFPQQFFIDFIAEIFFRSFLVMGIIWILSLFRLKKE